MSFEIMKKTVAEVEVKLPHARINPGKLVASEVREIKGDRLIKRIDYGNKAPNMMFERVVHRICAFPIGEQATGCIEDEFLWSRIGSGPDANHHANTVNLYDPITPWTNSIYMGTAQQYNSKMFLVNVPVSGSNLGGDYSMVIRTSHAHPEITGSAPVIVREVGYTNAAAAAATGPYGQIINSRILLDTPISLQPGQFLVTTYEYELKLPSYRVVDFNDIGITGLGASSGSLRFAAPIPAGNTVIVGSTRGVNIFYVQRSLTSAAVPSAVSGGAADAGAASRLGVEPTASFLSIQNNGVAWAEARRILANTTTGGNNPFNPAQPVYQNDGVRTINFWRARVATGGTDLLNFRSLFLFGYQFLFDSPFNILMNQDIAVSASLQWDLMRPI
jgi:hypothetical protein